MDCFTKMEMPQDAAETKMSFLKNRSEQVNPDDIY